MAEELPEGAAEPSASADSATNAPSRQRRMSLMWMILVPLLAVAIGLLCSDIFLGRRPQNAAFQRINDKLTHEAADDTEDSGGGFGGRRAGSQPLTADAVHDLLGRQPDSSQELNGNLNGKDNSDVEMEPILVETYKFPGIIEIYEVVVTYLEIPAGDNKPATTALKFVRPKSVSRFAR
jgi:hypothetical protein